VNSDDLDFLVEILSVGILDCASAVDAESVARYWAGELEVPSPVESDIDSYLIHSDLAAVIRAGLWVVNSHFLSGYRPKFHLLLVGWLYKHGVIHQSSILELVGLEGGSASLLNEAGKEIVLIARDMYEEGRLAEGVDTILPMLMTYTSQAGEG
jgi:hypothetical protein